MSSSNSPCAACKFLRRKCTQECVFAPYFPPDQPQKFANVHKVFGASNVAKILNEINTAQREDAVNSLAYEAEARLKDPVYGCVGLISLLQHKLKQVQSDLHNAKLELANYIGPSAMLPLLNPAGLIIPQIQNINIPSSSMQVLPNYNMQPILGIPSQNHPQIIETTQQHQQLVAVANSREQQEMLIRNFEQQQQQPHPSDLVRFSGSFDPAGGGSGQVDNGGAFVSPMTDPASVSPSLELGSTFHVNNNMYQMQPQEQPHQLLLQQETQQPLTVLRAAGNEEDRSVAP
nr:LOB domain-containing protein 36-like isoform X2 [Erigeron canadensis]